MAEIDLQQLETHAREFFAGHSCAVHTYPHGPTAREMPDFRVLGFGPGPKAQTPTYVSIGAAAANPRHREFILHVPAVHPTYVETLAMVAHYHATRTLDVGHTFPVGRPCFPGGTCDHFLVSLPYPFGPRLEHAVSGGHPVRFLWLLPVHHSEVRYRHEHDLEALETLFDEPPINILDGSRAPVV